MKHTPSKSSARLLALLLVAIAASACLSSCTPPRSSRAARGWAGPRCYAAKDRVLPLVVDGNASDRAALEALSKRGLLALSVEGCSLRILPQCVLPGSYRYVPLTPKFDRVMIRDQSELYANLPLGAVSLEGRLASAGSLDVAMAVVGRFETDPKSLPHGPLSGPCEAATHIAIGMSTGAFSFYAGSSSSAGADANILNVGAGAAQSSSQQVIATDGDGRACARSAASDTAPPFGCGALLRLDLVPIGGDSSAPPSCPPGTAWNGTQCVTAGLTVTCPAGTALQGGTCVAVTATGCPAGMHLEPMRGCVNDPQPANPVGAMVRIPAGAFRMGSMYSSDQQPIHEVSVAAFEIDLTEVTVAAYRVCVDQGMCTIPASIGISGSDAYGCTWESRTSLPNNPVSCVTARQAAAYCQFVGKRLPTEEEWEYAARGSDFRKYPWGMEKIDPTAICWNSGNITCRAGSHPQDRSFFGLLDMAGNMSEWTSSPYCTYGGKQCSENSLVMRGGNWQDRDWGAGHPDWEALMASRRSRALFGAADRTMGFRCAR